MREGFFEYLIEQSEAIDEDAENSLLEAIYAEFAEQTDTQELTETELLQALDSFLQSDFPDEDGESVSEPIGDEEMFLSHEELDALWLSEMVDIEAEPEDNEEVDPFS